MQTGNTVGRRGITIKNCLLVMQLLTGALLRTSIGGAERKKEQVLL